jgi:two-component system NarL family response regulator/two-component system response regulator DegU
MTGVIKIFSLLAGNTIVHHNISIISIWKANYLMIHMVIIDAKQEYRKKITHLLSHLEDFEVQGLGKDGYEAIRLVTSFKPDIAILGINLDIINGLDVLPLLNRQSPATLVVIMASKLDDNQISKAMSNKIAGFLLKDQDFDKLPVVLRDICFGKYYMNPQVSTRLFYILPKLSGKGRQANFISKQVYPLPADISKTELQIISCIGEGRSNQEIAVYLNLTAGTVRNYVSSAIHKTSVKDRTQLAIYALRNGLVNTDDNS